MFECFDYGSYGIKKIQINDNYHIKIFYDGAVKVYLYEKRKQSFFPYRKTFLYNAMKDWRSPFYTALDNFVDEHGDCTVCEPYKNFELVNVFCAGFKYDAFNTTQVLKNYNTLTLHDKVRFFETLIRYAKMEFDMKHNMQKTTADFDAITMLENKQKFYNEALKELQTG